MGIQLFDQTENITLVHEPFTIGENTLTINANDGYILSENGKWYTEDEESYELDTVDIVANNEKSMTIEINIDSDASSLTISMVAIENGESIPPEKKEISMVVDDRLVNCTLTNETYYIGENEIIIVAKDGYVISNNGTIEISDKYAEDYEVNIVANGGKEVRTKIELTDNDRELTLRLTAKKEEIKTNNFSNIYQTNDNELNQLSTSRWITGTGENTDTGRFITSLYKIPFSIEENLLVDSTIKLAKYNTDIPTKQVIRNDFTFKLFDKVIDRTFNNELDYDGLEVNFIIPFCDVINIKSSKVINKRIVVNVSLDLYTSYSTFYIYSDDEIIYVESKKIGSDIPYINQYNLDVVGDNSNLINEIKNVKVLLIRQKLIEEETYECDYEEELNKLKGYYIFNVDNVNISKNYNENDEIMRLLNDGIYIK